MSERDDRDEDRKLNLEDALGDGDTPVGDEAEADKPATSPQPTKPEKEETAEAWRTTAAFEYDPSMQEDIYVRAEEWDEWDTAKQEALLELKKDGVKDVTGREMDTAAARVIANNPDLLAEQLKQLRRE